MLANSLPEVTPAFFDAPEEVHYASPTSILAPCMFLFYQLFWNVKDFISSSSNTNKSTPIQ